MPAPTQNQLLALINVCAKTHSLSCGVDIDDIKALIGKIDVAKLESMKADGKKS